MKIGDKVLINDRNTLFCDVTNRVATVKAFDSNCLMVTVQGIPQLLSLLPSEYDLITFSNDRFNHPLETD